MKALPRVGVAAAALGALLVAAIAAAQPAARGDSIDLVPAAEAESLRRLLAASAPEHGTPEQLRRHYAAAVDAAQRLGDQRARRRLLEQAVQRLPDDWLWHNDLGRVLMGDGNWADSRRHLERARERAPDPAIRVFVDANLVRWRVQRLDPDAEAQLRAVRAEAERQLVGAVSAERRARLARTLGNLDSAEVTLMARRGRLIDQLRAAEQFEQRALAAVEAVKSMPMASNTVRRNAAADVSAAQKMRAAALRSLERDAEAEQVLLAHIAFIRSHDVGADHAASAHTALGLLRTNQREFAAAEQQFRLALEVLDRIGTAASSPVRADKVAELSQVLWAQGRRNEALAAWQAFDRAAGADGAPLKRRFAFSRGLALLGAGRAEEAAAMFADVTAAREREYGRGHFFTALAQGLHGVALWGPSSNATAREQGAELLKQAVLDLHAPRNADYLNDRALRRPLRELVHQAYVQAMAARGGLAALWAMGVADQLRGGVTAQAMADAAIRAAAGDPELATLVRQEQDARRELQSTEALLQAREPNEALPAEAAARLRARVAEVEALRAQVQQRIRERFPGYERIVRPSLADPAAIAQRLVRGEAFLMLMPDERQLLAWLVTADELPRFAALDVGAAELRQLVARVRQGLDFPGGRAPPFDHAAAWELYRRIFQPLEAALAREKQLVIAASGPLATLPFAALVTKAPSAPGGPPADAQAPWLARRFALAQVPGAAAWFALRQTQRALAAPEPFIGWGDPVFARAGGPSPRATAGGRGELAPHGPLRYDQIPALPESRDEVRAIAKALKADPERDLRLGVAATRDSVLEASRSGLLAKKRVVVFATHGLMAGDLPGLLQPALALAPPAEGPTTDLERNLVTLTDVLGLKMNAEWVVLSACNTAAGDGRGEEALSGLARGFFYAGARSLLVTQWAVETESAKRLTSATFEHQARVRDASKAESLRQAMLQLMAEPAYAHPAFWAAYMLVGDGAR